MPRMQRSIMGGALLVNRGGIQWTPSSYRQRKGMPNLVVPLDDVGSVVRRPMLGIRNAGVIEVKLRSGGEWVLSLQDSTAALDHLKQVGCTVSDPA